MTVREKKEKKGYFHRYNLDRKSFSFPIIVFNVSQIFIPSVQIKNKKKKKKKKKNIKSQKSFIERRKKNYVIL